MRVKKIHHVIKIVQRLANSHQHHMRNPFASVFLGGINFSGDFTRGSGPAPRPAWVEAQNRHPIAQPTWVDTQTVFP